MSGHYPGDELSEEISEIIDRHITDSGMCTWDKATQIHEDILELLASQPADRHGRISGAAWVRDVAAPAALGKASMKAKVYGGDPLAWALETIREVGDPPL